jgi:hypothetical protein
VRNQMKQSFYTIVLFLIAFGLTATSGSSHALAEQHWGDSVLANDVHFINQKLLKGRFIVNLSAYDTIRRGFCRPDKLNSREAVREFEGFNNVGDIDRDGKDDFVFVLHPLNRCEEGQSYYFSSPEIPRIETDSYCCHPKSLFSIGDIDEDGRNELGQYYSSCASRYKAMTIWSLKAGKWKEIKSFSYVLNDKYRLFTDFNKLFKKVAKGKLSYLEISDVDVHGRLVSQWKTVSVK